MKKIKTSELKRKALNWAVAKCEGVAYESFLTAEYYMTRREPGLDELPGAHHAYEYATSWAQGGPIIERLFSDEYGLRLRHDEERKGVWASLRTRTGRWFGPTALIAALRCYVASKLGDEVAVPEELLEEDNE